MSQSFNQPPGGFFNSMALPAYWQKPGYLDRVGETAPLGESDSLGCLLVKAASMIEANAECLRESCVTPDGVWGDERDRQQHDEEIYVAWLLRAIAGSDAVNPSRPVALYTQLVRAQQYLMESSEAYDAGCELLRKALDNWSLQGRKK